VSLLMLSATHGALRVRPFLEEDSRPYHERITHASEALSLLGMNDSAEGGEFTQGTKV